MQEMRAICAFDLQCAQPSLQSLRRQGRKKEQCKDSWNKAEQESIQSIRNTFVGMEVSQVALNWAAK